MTSVRCRSSVARYQHEASAIETGKWLRMGLPCLALPCLNSETLGNFGIDIGFRLVFR